METENLSQSAEKQEPPRSDLFFHTDILKGLVGYQPPMTEDPYWKRTDTIPVVELAQRINQRDRDQYLKEDYITFEDLVRRNTEKQYLDSRQILQNPESDPGMTALEQISLQMTLWKYEELHLKEYVDALERYREHLAKYTEKAETLRGFPDIQKLEVQTSATVGKLNQIIPMLQTCTRLVWCLDLIEGAKKKPTSITSQDLATVQKLEKSLRSNLPQQGGVESVALNQGSDLTTLRDAQVQLSGLMRSMLQQTVSVSGSDVQLPHGLYLSALLHQRDLSYGEMKNAETPTVKQYVEFMDVQNILNKESLSYHIDRLKNQADAASLLSMRERFLPEMGALESNPENAKNLADFYTTFLLPEGLEGALKQGELKRYLDGMTAYTDIVDRDAMQYGSMVDYLEKGLLAGKGGEDFMMKFKHLVATGAYVVPEWTLGWGRHIGLDYAKLVGQDDELKNHREYAEFKKLEQETQGIQAIIAERKPAIDGIREALKTDKAALLTLQGKHPPEKCIPGKKHEGVPYEDIKKQYNTVIETMREHHKKLTDEVDALYDDMQKNLSYHVGRKSELELLSNAKAPNYWIGAGLTIGEIYLLSELGRYGGVKSIPGVGWALRPLKSIPGYRLNVPLRAYHFAGRVANAPTRPFTGLYDVIARRMGWSPLPRIDEGRRFGRSAPAAPPPVESPQTPPRTTPPPPPTRPATTPPRTTVETVSVTSSEPPAPTPPTMRPAPPPTPAPVRNPAQAAEDLANRQLQRIGESNRLDAFRRELRSMTNDLGSLDDVDVGPGRGAARAQIRARAVDFQRRFNTFAKEYDSIDTARRVLAQEIVGLEPMSPQQWSILKNVHNKALGPAEKLAVLSQAFVPDKAKILMRTGLAGQTTLDAAETAIKGVTTLSKPAQDFLVDVSNANLGQKSVGTVVVNAEPAVIKEVAKVSPGVAKAEKALGAAKGSGLVTKGIVGVAALVDMILIADNHRELVRAEQAGKKDEIDLLRARQTNLTLSASGNVAIGLGISSVAVALPAAAVLGAGTWYAEELRGLKYELDTASAKKYTQLSSGQQLEMRDELESGTLAEAATGRGEETRSIRRAFVLEAFLRNHIDIESGAPESARSDAVRRGMAVMAYATRSQGEKIPAFSLGGPESLQKQAWSDLLHAGSNVSAIYALRDERVRKNPDNPQLVIEYEAEPGVKRTLDLSALPDVVMREEDVRKLPPLLAEFDRYQLSELRLKSTGETQQKILRRFTPEVALTEAECRKRYVGEELAVALYELRAQLQQSVFAMNLALQNAKTLDEIETADRSIRSVLLGLKAEELYGGASTDRSSPVFNPLKYAFIQPVGSDRKKESGKEIKRRKIQEARALLELETGVPLEICISVLIDGTR